jgi:hypothetical protein
VGGGCKFKVLKRRWKFEGLTTAREERRVVVRRKESVKMLGRDDEFIRKSQSQMLSISMSLE